MDRLRTQVAKALVQMFGDALRPYSTHEWMQMLPRSTYKQAFGGPESASGCKTLTGVEKGFDHLEVEHSELNPPEPLIILYSQLYS